MGFYRVFFFGCWQERRQSADVDCAVWDRVPLLVPPLAPSRLNHCSLIDVSYELLVTNGRSFVVARRINDGGKAGGSPDNRANRKQGVPYWWVMTHMGW